MGPTWDINLVTQKGTEEAEQARWGLFLRPLIPESHAT